jgi:hypothetical protein
MQLKWKRIISNVSKHISFAINERRFTTSNCPIRATISLERKYVLHSEVGGDQGSVGDNLSSEK